MLLRVSVAAAAAMAGQTARLEAASIVYAQSSGNWSTAASWSPAQLPTSVDSAFIRVDREVTVDSNVGNVINVYLGQTGSGGTLILNTGASLGVSNNFEVMRQGTFGNIGGTLSMNGGTLGVSGALLVGAGGVNTTGTSSGTATISGGTVTAPITIGSSLGTSLGYFNVLGSTAAISGSAFTSNSSGRISFAFDSIGISMLDYSGGTASFAAGSLFAVDGSLYAGAGGDFTLVDSATLNWNVEPENVSITGFDGFNTQLLTANNEVVLRLTAVPELSATVMLATLPLLGLRRSRRPFITA